MKQEFIREDLENLLIKTDKFLDLIEVFKINILV